MSFLDRLDNPVIIQGGMGVRVSHPRLARTVGRERAMGVVSSVALDTMLIRELQTGDRTGEVREALEHYPNQSFVDQAMTKYFIEGGKGETDRYKLRPIIRGFNQEGNDLFLDEFVEELVVAGTFVEVMRAKKNNDGVVGINFLHEIQWPLLPGIYGAMLAGADAVLIGAGFAKGAAAAMDAMSQGELGRMPIVVENSSEEFFMRYMPKFGETKRSDFWGIISLETAVRALPDANGYVIEGPIAGGHNPPPRNKSLNEKGEPDFTEKDEVNIEKLHKVLERNADKLGFKQPFFLAGNYALRLAEAAELGAAGIQVGTPFGYSVESGMDPSWRRELLQYFIDGGEVFTHPRASPSGYPFKIPMMPGTMAMEEVYQERNRVCDLNYLIHPAINDGELIVRCPAEPVGAFKRKGGSEEDTTDRRCLCNNLAANTGYGSPGELPIFTAGGELGFAVYMAKKYGLDYSAVDVIKEIRENAGL